MADGSDRRVSGDFVDHPSCAGALTFSGTLTAGNYQLLAGQSAALSFKVTEPEGGCRLTGATGGGATGALLLLSLLGLWLLGRRKPNVRR